VDEWMEMTINQYFTKLDEVKKTQTQTDTFFPILYSIAPHGWNFPGFLSLLACLVVCSSAIVQE